MREVLSSPRQAGKNAEIKRRRLLLEPIVIRLFPEGDVEPEDWAKLRAELAEIVAGFIKMQGHGVTRIAHGDDP